MFDEIVFPYKRIHKLVQTQKLNTSEPNVRIVVIPVQIPSRHSVHDNTATQSHYVETLSYFPQFQDIFVNDSVSSGTQDQSSGSIGTVSRLHDPTMGFLASSLRFQEFETHSSTSYTLSSPTDTSPLLHVLDSSLLIGNSSISFCY